MEFEKKFDAAEAEGHALRSKMLDQFAQIEAWVAEKTSMIGNKPSKASLGQRIKSLRNYADRFKYPKRIGEFEEELGKMVELRNDLVHAVLITLLDKNGEPQWHFKNVGLETSGVTDVSRSITLTREDFAAKSKWLNGLTKRLNDQRLKQPTPTAPASSSD